MLLLDLRRALVLSLDTLDTAASDGVQSSEQGGMHLVSETANDHVQGDGVEVGGVLPPIRESISQVRQDVL